MQAGSRKVDTAQVARNWLDLGIYTVPLKSETKKPKGWKGNPDAKGWNKLRITEDTVGEFFERGDNIGGLWGKPSGWVVDIDLDNEEARIAARTLLPETYIYGRREAPGSHYLFVSEGIETKKFQTPELGVICEIRSTGTQSVLPPSKHPSGDRYEVYHESAFTPLPRGRLEQAVRLVAAASVCAYYYPEDHGRHDFVHALAGALLHTNWPDEEVKRFLLAVLNAAKNKEDAKGEREYTVRNTIKNYHAKARVQGWPTMSQWMPGAELKVVKDWLKLEATVSTDETPPDYLDAPTEPKIDPKLLKVPGLVGTIANWSSRRSYSMQPLFDLAVGLMTVAFFSKNKYTVAAWDTPIQPYFLLVAPTASGKESAMNSVYTIARKLGVGDRVFQGFQSYHSMLDILSQPPHTALWLWDEMARKLKAANRASSSMEAATLTHLLELYGKGNSHVPGNPARKNPVPPLDHPFFTIFAATQPSQLIEAVTEGEVSLGLINRFILLDAGEELPDTNSIRTTLFPSKIENALRAMVKVKRPTEGEFININFENARAHQIFKDYVDFARVMAAKGGGWEMWGRSNQNALILAGILAVGVDAVRPIITQDIAHWATDFISWCSERWTSRIEQSASRSFTERGSKYLERIIFNPRIFEHKTLGAERELVKKGLTPASLVARLARHMRKNELADTLSHLVLSGLIVVGEIDGISCYWPKRG